jgi:hypothetical protein
LQEESGIAESPQSDEAEVLALMRTPGLSIKNLDPEKKEKIRKYILKKHVEQGVSLSDLAKLIGNKTSGYTSWLTRQLGIQSRDFEEARLKGIHEKVRKYERRPFDGTDEDKAYMLGLRHGDLSVSRPFGDAIRVSTSTTHPTMAALFRSLFERFGHVYQHPRFKKDTRTYEWNLSTILDPSFEFLLEDRAASWSWIQNNVLTILAYLAGAWDAEGSVAISENANCTAIMLPIFNTDTAFLGFIKSVLIQLGYHPVGPYLDKRKGTFTSKYKIERKKDYWKLVLARFDESQSLLRKVNILHPEKTARKDLALSIKRGTRWVDICDRVKSLRRSELEGRDAFVRLAEITFLRTHPETKVSLQQNDATDL